MQAAFPGMGTVINVATVLLGAILGLFVGHRIPERTRNAVTDCLGLVTLLMAGLSLIAVTDQALTDALPTGSAVLVVLGSLLIGSIIGSLLGVERRMESLAGVLQAWFAKRSSAESGDNPPAARERFIEGWLTTSLLFCIGPLTFLGSLSDGMGRGIDQLALKSVLDGFAALAFAASFGVGVIFSALSVAIIQGLFTLAGVLLGALMPDYQVSALTAVGGLLLVGVAFRLLRLRDLPVGDMLPALLVTPMLTWAVSSAFG